MENELTKVLFVDDEEMDLFNFEKLFHDDFEVYTAISAAKGMEILTTTDIQIIVSDQRMPEKSGIEFFAEVAQLYPDTIRIILTAYSEVSVIIDAINRGQVYQYITKPFEVRNVKNILYKATQHWRVKRENEALLVQLRRKNEEYEVINEELRRTNEELYAGNHRIADLAERLILSQEASGAGTWDWDIRNKIFYWSEEFLKLFGMGPGTVPGFESWTKSLHPEDLELASKRIQDAIDEKTDLLQFYRIVLSDGNLRWIRATGKVTYQNDIPIRMIGLCIDVTEQKHTEEKLSRSESELKRAQQITHIGSWYLDLATNEVAWTEELYKMYGFDPTLPPPPYTEHQKLFTPASWELLSSSLANTIDSGIPYEIELETVKDNGSNGWMWARGEPVKDPDGKTTGLWGAAQDISGRKRAEEMIRGKDIQFRKLSANVSDLIFQFTRKPDGTYYVPIASEGIRNIFGCSPEDVLNDFAPISRVIYPDDAARVISDIEYSAEHLTYFTCEFRVQIPGKEVQWIYSKSTPEKLADGSITWYGFNSDITQRKLAEDSLEKSRVDIQKALEVSNRSRQSLLSVLEDQGRSQKEIIKLNAELEHRVKQRTAQLEAVNKELEAFSYSVSHDLRAPLRHISGFSDILSKDVNNQLSEKSKFYLDIISSSAIKMGILIDDLLSFSRTGRAEMEKSDFNMNQVVEEVVSQIKISNPNRKINWNIANLPRISGDCNLLRLVWVNLIENAVKYTKTREQAEIHISCISEKEEFIFSIRDNGVGFDMKYAGKLYGVFQRLHSSAEFEGTGIGLANVRRIILRHGGRTWAEAELEKGSTFYFTLPQ